MALTVAAPLRIAPFGVYAPAVVTGAITHSAVGNATRSTADAVLNASVELLNGGAASATAAVVATVFDSTGSRIGTATASSGNIPAGQPTASTVAVPPIPLPKATLWSVEDPALYVVQVEVKSSAGELLDALNTTIGIRKIEFDADQGFLLNSRRTKILGACNHQDFGGLGVAVPDALQEHRVERMKSFGINAWRTAHNPPTPGLLDATDKLGLLVWDENHKVDRSAAAETLVRRDRNHPSVIIWYATMPLPSGCTIDLSRTRFCSLPFTPNS